MDGDDEMTTVYSFCGNCTYVCENQSEVVVVDRSYNYGLPSDGKCSEGMGVSPIKKIIKYDTGIAFDERHEVQNRRIRIAKLMLYIIDDLLDDDDVIFIDADVGIPNVKDVARTQPTNTSFCIPAINKDSPFREIIRFCYSTNMCVKDVDLLRHHLIKYLREKFYEIAPVDVYINLMLNMNRISVDGTWHYINGKKYVLKNVLGSYLITLG